jgi:hypothetical protein
MVKAFFNILLVLCKLYECSHSAEGLSEGCAEGRNEVLLLFFACFFNFAFNNAKIRKNPCNQSILVHKMNNFH